MEFLKTIKKRKSVRKYQSTQVPDTIIDDILKAGCAAPVSLKQYDSLHITVIQNPAILQTISESIKQIRNQQHDPLYGAPTVILISSKKMPAEGLDYANFGFVAENMTLAATDQGIGSVVIWGVGLAVQQDKALQAKINLPANFEPIASVAIGYSAEDTSAEKVLGMNITSNIVR